MKKVLVFDFDGTIADTESEFIRIFNQLAQKHKFLKITEDNRETFRELAPLKFFQEAKIPIWKLPVLMLEGKRELQKTIEVVNPSKGVKEQLIKLRNNGHTLHILTSNSKENVIKFLEKNEMMVFDLIHTGSSVFGKDKHILSLIKKNSLNKKDVWYVGDEIRDIEATKKAGVKMIAVTWGYGSKKSLAKYKPDFLIDKPEELLKIV